MINMTEPSHVKSEPLAEKEISVVVETANDTRSSSDTESQLHDTKWESGLWKQFPWLGLGGLFIVVMSSIAALLVLVTSDKKPASEWLGGRLAPNVLLSVFNNISNLAITVAVGQGVAINWWRRALFGSTVEQLHYSWSFSTSVIDIFRKYRYFNIIALAIIMAKIAVIDGVLYQKATTTYLDIVRGNKHNETIHTFGAEIFPMTAKMGYSQNFDGQMTYRFEEQVLHWFSTQEDIDTAAIVTNCNGADCHYNLPGAGFSMTCNTTSVTIDYGKSALTALDKTPDNTAGFTDLPLFSVNFSRSWPSVEKAYSALILDVVYAHSLDNTTLAVGDVCPMNLTRTTCELRPSLLDYKLQYTNSTSTALVQQRNKPTGPEETPHPAEPVDTSGLIATLNGNPNGTRLDYDCPGKENFFDQSCGDYDPEWNQVRGVKFLRHVDIVEDFVPSANSTLEGFYLAFKNVLQSYGTLSYLNNTWLMKEQGVEAIAARQRDPPQGSCNFTFRDPMKSVMQSVNILTLMASQNEFLYYNTVADTGKPDQSQPLGGIDPAEAKVRDIVSVVHYEDVFYASAKVYMYSALAATFVVVLCIAPVFWGYWELGRQVTLGPIEIANAFQGPTFAGVRGDHVEEVLRSVGKQTVKYGQMENERGQRLGFKVA